MAWAKLEMIQILCSFGMESRKVSCPSPIELRKDFQRWKDLACALVVSSVTALDLAVAAPAK